MTTNSQQLEEPKMKICLSLVLLTAMGLAWAPAAFASSITISANPSSGTIYNFPAVPFYQNFASSLTVSGAVTGTPTWSYAPAPGSPICANYIRVTFGNVNAWNTTATFDDHAGASCGPVTMNLTVTSTTGLIESIGLQVTYGYCRNCT